MSKPWPLTLALLLGLAMTPEFLRAAPALPAAGAQVKLTFWNVEWFPGRRPDARETARKRHVAAVVPVIKRLDPDVLGLEEVADGDAARLLTDVLPGGYRVDVATDFRRENGDATHQQTILASRLPLVNGWWESWAPTAAGLQPRRGFAFAAYQPAPGQVLLVYALHLKSNREDEPGGAATNTAMRVESARQLAAHARSMATAYAGMGAITVVFGGDLNTSLDDPRFAAESTLRDLIKEGYQWAFQNVPPTARVSLPGGGRYPDTTFDHVFFRDFGSVGVGSCWLLDVGVEPTGLECSDHRPVSVTLALGGKN